MIEQHGSTAAFVSFPVILILAIALVLILVAFMWAAWSIARVKAAVNRRESRPIETEPFEIRGRVPGVDCLRCGDPIRAEDGHSYIYCSPCRMGIRLEFAARRALGEEPEYETSSLELRKPIPPADSILDTEIIGDN